MYFVNRLYRDSTEIQSIGSDMVRIKCLLKEISPKFYAVLFPDAYILPKMDAIMPKKKQLLTDTNINLR